MIVTHVWHPYLHPTPWIGIACNAARRPHVRWPLDSRVSFEIGEIWILTPIGRTPDRTARGGRYKFPLHGLGRSRPLEPSPGGPLPMNLVQQELINKLITIIRSCDHHATKQQPEVHARDQLGSSRLGDRLSVREPQAWRGPTLRD
jgi:hypothetical protein